MEYKEFDITEVAQRLGLRFIKAGPGNELIYRCPFCGDSNKHPNKGHLYISKLTNQFKCHRCGQIGNSVSLWAQYKRIDNKQAYKELERNVDAGPVHIPSRTPQIKHEKVIADIRDRHRTYIALLKILKLRPDHKGDLIRRGLKEIQIHQNMYKTIPQNAKFRWKVTRFLKEKGFQLEGVPGFFTRKGKYGIFWDFVSPPGYLIPARDNNGRIQAMQVRLDDGKYIWFSSYGMPNGTSSRAPAHFTGGKGQVWITEGPLKADVASTLMNNTPFVGIPGVNAWEEAGKILNSLGTRDFIVAFDSDAKENPQVANALQKFLEHLKANGFNPQNASWPKSIGKGIDDALLKLHKKEVNSITFLVNGVPVTIKRTVTTTVSVG